MFHELAATRESQVTQLEYENSVLSRLLRQEYQQRFDAAKVPPARQEMVAQSVRKILSNRARYERITKSMTIALVLPRDNSWHGSRLQVRLSFA